MYIGEQLKHVENNEHVIYQHIAAGLHAIRVGATGTVRTAMAVSAFKPKI